MKNTLLAFIITMLISVGLAMSCYAADPPAGNAVLNADITLTENLLALQGKQVTVTLASGQVFTGVVKTVKNGLLHLEKLSQKDFFDALIVVEKIGAVEARVR